MYPPNKMMLEVTPCDCVFFVRNNEKSAPWPEHYETCAKRLLERKFNGEFQNGLPRNKDGSLKQTNPYLKDLEQDFLYHLALDTKTHNMPAMFGDVKFVCMGGTSERMEQLVKLAVTEFGMELPTGCGFVDLTVASHRYCMYKAGPILSINHGIGVTTLSVVLLEVIKLLQYAGAKDPIIVRVGTSGGINVEAGTVVVSDKCYDGMLKESYDLPILGKMVSMPAKFDKRLSNEVAAMAEPTDDFKTVNGGTMCANDFYNGQGRVDGPFCDYKIEDKMEFLTTLKELGVKNIEMEATCLAALTHMAGIKSVDVCVTFLDRLNGDQVTTPKATLLEWQERPMVIAFRYIKRYLQSIGRFPYGKC